MDKSINTKDASKSILILDDALSKRLIELDPTGYFLIRIDKVKNIIIAEHYINDIDDKGRAVDVETGQPISCKEGIKRSPDKVFTGKSAKEIGIKITENSKQIPISKFDHALYLGRELQKAENCMILDSPYIQD
tara:strand:+ start:191 stop:592 length:402 start_codon:yes stop_codon:yes gene_type:complete